MKGSPPPPPPPPLTMCSSLQWQLNIPRPQLGVCDGSLVHTADAMAEELS